jgi:hypothetical protein
LVTINTQGIQEWSVPTTGTYRIEAIGAAGGADNGGTSGKGARIIGDFSLSQGAVLKIIVGQSGLLDASSSNYSAGGGGGSFALNASSSPYVIAGGGGGSNGLPQIGNDASISTSGLNGYSNSNPGNYGVGGINGYGATGDSPCSGNGGGLLGNGENSLCKPDSYGYGVNNAALGGSSDNGLGGFGGGGGGGNHGAGGGGGYSGGGGNYHYPGNGGGGGSYNSGTNPTNTAGFSSGNGQVIITKL